MNQEDSTKIEDLNKSLYSRSTPNIRTKRRLRFYDQEVGVKTDWEHKEEKTEAMELNTRYKSNSMSFFTKILIWSFVFFVISIAIGAFILLKGSNIVSAKNVDITVNGPVSVAGGEPVSFQIQVSNQNNIKLETVDMSIEFPTGTTDTNDSFKELKNTRDIISDIEPGGVGQKTVQAVLYGEENTKKEIKIVVEYRVKGSNAVFQKEKTFDILISSSPISLTISAFKEVNSGQEFEFTANINSNSKEVIKNLLLKAYYPFGFTYTSSDVKPLSDNSTWRIGDIPPGAKRTIKIKGKLEGQDDEVRVFKFSAGAFSVRNEKIIGTEYISSSQEISIKKPFMSVAVSMDGNSDDQEYIATFNEPIRVEIKYFNNLPVEIIDGEIKVKLSGNAFDKISVIPDQGLYKSADNEIIWNGINTNDLKNIEAGGSGRVLFSITPRDLGSSFKSVLNPYLKFDINVKGNRISEIDVPESISSSVVRQAKIASNISLNGQVLRSTGPFQNTGSIPPRAEQPTTYTIVWYVDNTSSTVSDAIVRSSLPAYMKWTGKIEPANENIKFNEVNGQIEWNVGNVGTYTMGTDKRKKVSFQVLLNPSVDQIGQTLTLVDQSSLIAQDDFTGETLRSNLGILSSAFESDPSFKDGDQKVIK
ncbi:MAG: hypothetical protein AAB683_01545 [Patescibacteria group bacterium]